MLFRVPIYLATERPPGGGPAVQTGRPLFFPDLVERSANLNRLMARLARRVSERLAALARLDRHDELADWSFCPELAQERLELTVHLRRRTARVRYLFVTFRHLGRRVAFTPSQPELWFDLLR